MPKLTPDQINERLVTVPEWQKNDAMISRTYKFKDFLAAMEFVNRVAPLVEQANHHPDIDIRWNKVTLALTTHSEGALTEKDFDLAQKCDRLV